MVFNLKEYVQFYWTVYYTVRAEYFPNDAWRLYFKDKSPVMWESDILGKKTSLGKELFGKGTRYIYLNLTHYSERRTRELPVDDGFLILAFNKIGCRISEEERTNRRLTDEMLPIAQLELFKKRYQNYIDSFPPLEQAVATKYNEILENIGEIEPVSLGHAKNIKDGNQLIEIDSPISGNISVSKNTVTQEKISESEAEKLFSANFPIVNIEPRWALFYKTIVGNREVISCFHTNYEVLYDQIKSVMTKFIACIMAGNFNDAINCMASDKAHELFGNDVSRLESLFESFKLGGKIVLGQIKIIRQADNKIGLLYTGYSIIRFTTKNLGTIPYQIQCAYNGYNSRWEITMIECI